MPGKCPKAIGGGQRGLGFQPEAGHTSEANGPFGLFAERDDKTGQRAIFFDMGLVSAWKASAAGQGREV